MANTITTALCDSFKSECVSGGHCFAATQSALSCSANTTTAVTALTTVANLSVGMIASGTNITGGTVLSRVTSQTSVQLDLATTGAVSSITFTGDAFKAALVNPTGSNSAYGRATANVGTPGTTAGNGTTNLGTDETSGTGYTAGGVAMTNVQPAVSAGNGAYWGFSNNPSWSSATFSAIGMIIYNTTVRLGASANGITANASGSAINRAVSVHSFGGTQSVSGGTFTVTIPSTAWGTALYQLS